MDYDRVFRQQASVDPSLRWNTLLPGLQASTMLGFGLGQGAMFCNLCHKVERLITLGLSVPCFLYIPQQIAPLTTRLPLSDANQTISASHGTGACASSRVIVDISTFVPPVTCHTKRGIVQRPLTAPFISSNAAPLHNPAHMLHLLLSPMPARENC